MTAIDEPDVPVPEPVPPIIVPPEPAQTPPVTPPGDDEDPPVIPIRLPGQPGAPERVDGA